LDPAYALAYVRLTEYYWVGMVFGFIDPREAFPRAKAAALEAVRLDETLAEAHSALGLALGSFDFDWAGADREFRCALELNPASPEVRFHRHFCLWATGRLEEALTEMRRAREQDPLSPLFNAHLGLIYHETRQPERAVAHHRLAIELDPNFWLAHWWLALAYFSMGLLDEALTIAEKGIEHFGRYPQLLMCAGTLYASTGRTAEARQLLEELEARRRTAYVSSLTIGTLHLALGEVDRGLEWLARAVEDRDVMAVLGLNSELFYDPLRLHPAFQALLRKMNLAP
jgi:tetratricopeptide (TPR) repeat protein